MELRFIKATENDIHVIAHLADVIWKKHYPDIITMEQIDFMLMEMYSPQALLKQMKEGHHFTLAYMADAPVGYISIHSKDDKNYFINKFYVLVSQHRQGIGGKLFRHVLNQIPQAQTIELAVNRMNYKAVNFYFKQGFTIKNSFDLHIGQGFYMNDFLMIKTIGQ